MAGLADFGYLYGAANQGSSAAFTNRQPVDPNAPKVGSFPVDLATNLTNLTTFEQSQRSLGEARETARANAAKNAILLGRPTPAGLSLENPSYNNVPFQTPAAAPILAVTQSEINNPQEPLVYTNVPGPQGSYVASPYSQTAGLKNQLVTDQQATEAALLKAQVEKQAALEAAGYAYPTSGTNEAAEAYRGIVFGKKVTTGNKSGMFSTFQSAPPENTVLVNGEPISQSAYERLAGASQTMAKILSITDPAQMPPGAKAIIEAARKAGVDPKIALAVGVMESNLNTETGDSPKGAKGVMQVIPGTYEATRQKFMKSSDPALRALAASLPMAARGTKNADGTITYSWDTKVALTADQQATAGVLYLKDLQQSYPNRAANIIFAMYHAGPGYDAFDRGEIPGGLSDFGTDPKTSKPYGMYTRDYNTVGIGLFNQLAQGGFKDIGAAGLNTNTSAAAPAQGTAQGPAQGTAVSIASPTTQSTALEAGVKAPTKVDPVTQILNRPQAEIEASLRDAGAARSDYVSKATGDVELFQKYTAQEDARIREAYLIKAEQIGQDIEVARASRNGNLVNQLQRELVALNQSTNAEINALAQNYDLKIKGANEAISANLRVHDLGLWNIKIQNSIRDFSSSGNVTDLNDTLNRFAGTDMVIQQLANGSYAMLNRRQGTNEYNPELDANGGVKMYSKGEAASLFRQIVDPKYAAEVTAATAARDKLIGEETLKSNLKRLETADQLSRTLFNTISEKVTQAQIDAKVASGELVAAKVGDTSVFYRKGNPENLFMLEPAGEIIAADGSVMPTSPKLVSVAIPGSAGLRTQ
jgi:hypothetical protein